MSKKIALFMITIICVTLDVIGENLTGWVKIYSVVEGCMEAVIKLMIITRNVQSESDFTGKGKAVIKPCVCSVCQSLLEDFTCTFLMVQICI